MATELVVLQIAILIDPATATAASSGILAIIRLEPEQLIPVIYIRARDIRVM